jgi:hypothetical protein
MGGRWEPPTSLALTDGEPITAVQPSLCGSFPNLALILSDATSVVDRMYNKRSSFKPSRAETRVLVKGVPTAARSQLRRNRSNIRCPLYTRRLWRRTRSVG